jgi:hypothetical protein
VAVTDAPGADSGDEPEDDVPGDDPEEHPISNSTSPRRRADTRRMDNGVNRVRDVELLIQIAAAFAR